MLLTFPLPPADLLRKKSLSTLKMKVGWERSLRGPFRASCRQAAENECKPLAHS